MDNSAARFRHLRLQRVDILPAVGRKRDDLDAVLPRLVQSNDMVLVMAVGLEPDHAVCRLDFDQPPVIRIEGTLGVEVLDAVTDIADLGHSAHHRFLVIAQIGSATRSNISAVARALSTGGPLPSCPWQIASERSTM